MKKFSFLAMAALGLLFAACSSDKDVAENGSSAGILDGKAEGFFKINLNLPTAPVVSTRSWAETDEGILNDGLNVEYGVNTCLLLLFDGASESAATLKQVVDITGTFNGVADNPNHITSNYEKVVKLDNTISGNLYALAVINGKGNIEFNSATSIKLRKTDGSGLEEKSGCKIADLQAALTKSASVKANDFIYEESSVKYFFMTNAVLSNEKGGTTKPTTAAGNQHILAPVDKAFIYDTEQKANDGHAAADIYVERGMAKVTIKANATSFLGTTAIDGANLGTGILSANATLTGWCLDITNKTSYVVRQVPTGNIWDLCSFGTTAGADKYRFVGGNSVDGFYGTNVAGYRTYWAKDTNYDDDLTFDTNNQNTTNFSYANFANDAIAGTGDNNPLYCLENTFDVAHQDARYTTRAILGVKLTSDNSDFYIMGADRKTLYKEADVKNQVLTNLKNSSKFSDWYATNGGGHTLVVGDITITWDKAADAAGVIKVQSITIKKGALSSTYLEDLTITTSAPTELADNATATPAVTGVITTLNNQLVNVERFVGGVTYYPIRIKHFGDDLTPWNTDEYGADTAPAESTIATIYPDNSGKQNANYLGRYGVVRNNWYELVIGDILKVGYSEPPTIPSHPDDDLEDSFIKARINILSWAKRPQNWNLK